MISHLSLGTNDLERAAAFYDAVLPTLGYKRVLTRDDCVAYGDRYPAFWIVRPLDESRPAAPGNGTHVAFHARTRDMVHAFHAAALKAGARDNGAPGPRPEYGELYYGAFVIDPDGHKIEAECYGAG
ncbi:MAG: VOC family protein [Rhodospirillales bacterium]|nr:VOC family protein [Rhodospirillales bacterium]